MNETLKKTYTDKNWQKIRAIWHNEVFKKFAFAAIIYRFNAVEFKAGKITFTRPESMNFESCRFKVDIESDIKNMLNRFFNPVIEIYYFSQKSGEYEFHLAIRMRDIDFEQF